MANQRKTNIDTASRIIGFSAVSQDLETIYITLLETASMDGAGNIPLETEVQNNIYWLFFI